MAPPPAVPETRLIRRLGAIELRTGLDAEGVRRLVMAPAAEADPAAARGLLDRIASAHQRLMHPMVPRLLHQEPADRPPALIFDCDALVDVETLGALVAEARLSIDPAGAAAFAIRTLQMLRAVHEATAAGGSTLCMGAFSTSNILVSADGRFFYTGWGHPAHGTDRSGLLGAIPTTFTAPEVAFGVAPSPGSDLLGAVLLFHSFLQLASAPEPVVRALRGEPTPGFETLPKLAFELMSLSHAVAPEQRDLGRFLEVFDRALEALGLRPDDEALKRNLGTIAGAWLEQHAGPAPLRVGDDGRWFQLPGAEVVWLERRGPLRRMVLALAEHRLAQPGLAWPWEDLVARAWPGQHPTPESARNRVYVAIASLRNLGLREALLTRDEGYLIDPALPVTLVREAPDGKKPA